MFLHLNAPIKQSINVCDEKNMKPTCPIWIYQQWNAIFEHKNSQKQGEKAEGGVDGGARVQPTGGETAAKEAIEGGSFLTHSCASSDSATAIILPTHRSCWEDLWETLGATRGVSRGGRY